MKTIKKFIMILIMTGLFVLILSGTVSAATSINATGKVTLRKQCFSNCFLWS